MWPLEAAHSRAAAATVASSRASSWPAPDAIVDKALQPTTRKKSNARRRKGNEDRVRTGRKERKEKGRRDQIEERRETAENRIGTAKT